ncbi:NADH-cytochrome b5 reductase [Mortierella claussenii]|nr:NADH-cytochrome b5 reductase [Mortierella claussenii]
MAQFIGKDGKLIIRPYVPTSETHVNGSWDLVIKRYETGVMSSHIHSLQVGDSLAVKVHCIARRRIWIDPHAAIDPQYPQQQGRQLTKVNFIFANVTPDDIILKDVLDDLIKIHPDQFKVTYVISKPPEGYEGVTGHVSAEWIKKAIPEIGSEGNKVFVCGPPGFMKAISGEKGPNYTQGDVSGALKNLGLTNEQVFKF